MSDLRRLRDGVAATTAKKAIPPPRGLSAVSRIWAVLSLGRIVMINVLALGVTAVVAVHVMTRPSRATLGPAASERAISAATPLVAPADSSGTPSAAPIEVDLDRADPSLTERGSK